MILILPFAVAVAIYPEMLEFLMTGQNNDDNLTHLLHGLAPISTTGVFVDALSFVLIQDLRVIDKNITSALLSVTGMWVGVLAGYLLGFTANLGINGIATGYTGGLVARAASLYWCWRKGTTPEKLQHLAEKKANVSHEKSTFQKIKDYWQCPSVFFCCRKKPSLAHQLLTESDSQTNVQNAHHESQLLVNQHNNQQCYGTKHTIS